MIIANHPRHGKVLVISTNNPKPAQVWLDVQKTPFKNDAEWTTVYPYSGGACTVDYRDLNGARETTNADICEFLEIPCNPGARYDVLERLG